MEGFRSTCEVCGSVLLQSEHLMPCRCLAHIVHLGAKHIVEAFTQDGQNMESEIPMDDFQVDNGLATNHVEYDKTSYATGDSLGKLWAFINQVCDCSECYAPKLLVFRFYFPHKHRLSSSSVVPRKICPILNSSSTSRCAGP